MKNKRFNRNMCGSLPTQKMAQKALPILISSAQEDDPVIMRDLAKKTDRNRVRFFSVKFAQRGNYEKDT